MRKGKPVISFSAMRQDNEVVLAIADDGSGIQWDSIRARALRLGLPAMTKTDLVEAMFTDGVTTRDAATDISGRGVGLSALRHAVRALGGTIEVTSMAGSGTRLEMRFDVSHSLQAGSEQPAARSLAS
jgi:two-component system, chemotaxis family, sensor kinase CheA